MNGSQHSEMAKAFLKEAENWLEKGDHEKAARALAQSTAALQRAHIDLLCNEAQLNFAYRHLGITDGR